MRSITMLKAGLSQMILRKLIIGFSSLCVVTIIGRSSSSDEQNKTKVGEVSEYNNKLIDSIYEKAASEVCNRNLTNVDVGNLEELANLRGDGGGVVSYCYGVLDKLMETNDKNHTSFFSKDAIVSYLSKCDYIEPNKVKQMGNAGSTRLLVCSTIDTDRAHCQDLINTCQDLVTPIMTRFVETSNEFQSKKK